MILKLTRQFRIPVYALIAGILILSGCAGNVARKPATREAAAEKRKAMDLFIEGKVAEAKGNFDGAITSYIEALQYDSLSEEITLAIAKAFLKSRKPRSALHYASAAVRLNPEKPEAWRLLQQLYQLDGKIEDAAEALEMYIKLQPEKDFVDKIWLARYYFDMHKGEDARDMLLSAIKEDGVTAEEMSGAANLLAEEGFIDESISIYTHIVERDPMNVDGWITLGELYEHSRLWDDARETYLAGLERNPESADLMVAVGNLCLFENDWDCAIQWFEKANAGRVDVPKIRKTLTALYFYSGREKDALASIEAIQEAGEDDAGFWFSMGKAMNYLSRYNDAVSYYRRGFEKGVDDLREEELFTAYGNLASAFVNLGRHDDAIDLVRKGAAKHIKNREGLKLLEASIYNDMKRYEDAILIYEWLLASEPENIHFLMVLGQTYNRAGQFGKAEETFLKVKEIDPDNIDYLIQLSLVYDLSGQFKKAEKALLQVLDKEPEHALALNNLAYMYIEHDTNLSKAIDMARSALDMEPRNGAYHDTLGWGYYKKGQYDEAKTYIEKALKWEDSPDKGVIYEHYGDILGRLGLNSDAVEAYRTAIELGENPDTIQPKIDALTR